MRREGQGGMPRGGRGRARREAHGERYREGRAGPSSRFTIDDSELSTDSNSYD